MKNASTKNINRFFINLFFILSFSISLSAQNLASQLLQTKAKITEDITYKKDDLGNNLQLDIYQPINNNQQKKPVVVFLHGGAWVEGDKAITANNYVENTIEELLENDFVVISANYRLLNENVHFPGPAEDAKDVIRWIRKNADQYRFDTDNIGMWGVSAGAHLSFLTAFTQNDVFAGDKSLAPYSAKVNYVVSNYGPTDINRLLHTRAPKPMIWIVTLISKKIIDLRQKLVMGMTGLDIKKDKKEVVKILQTISPLTYTQNTVPTLMLHGDKDKVAPLNHSKRMKKMLTKQGTFNELIVVQGGNHGFKDTDPNYQAELNKAMVDFIKSQKK